MAMTSPGWLVGLLPWAMVAARLFRAAGRSVSVSHLRFWREAAGAAAPRRASAWRWPPVGVLLGLGGMALAVVAAGGPHPGARRPAIVILDRGWAMSAGGRPFRGTVDRAAALLAGRPATLVCVPALDQGAGPAGDDWAAQASRAEPTAVETGAELDAVVERLLRRAGDAPVLVLTDRPLATRDSRVVAVTPDRRLGGVGIVALAARDRPWRQVMATLENRSGTASTRIGVRAGAAQVQRAVAIAPRGTTDLFVDLPGAADGATVSVTTDATAIDGKAWLAVGSAAARVVATPNVPVPVRRMVEVFNALEGAASGSPVVASSNALATDQAGVWVEPATDQGGATVVRGHPVAADVRAWMGGGAAVPAGFSVIVRVAGRAVVAVRDGPGRQVWVNPNVERWSRSADWVVFFANAFRWAAGGAGPAYAASGPRAMVAGWHLLDGGPLPTGLALGLWPGLYGSDDGGRVAVNARVASAGPAAMPDPLTTRVGGVGMAPAVCVAAVVCLLGTATAWPATGRGRRRRP